VQPVQHCVVIIIPSHFHWIGHNQPPGSHYVLSSMWAKSNSEHSVWHSHFAALLVQNASGNWLSLYQMHRQPLSCLRSHLDFQVIIWVQPILRSQNVCRGTVVITFSWMTVDSLYAAEIKYLSSTSMEVLPNQCWWHRWFLHQLECSHTSMLKVWPGCIYNLFSIRNIFFSCHLLVLNARVILCSKYVMAAQPYLQKVVDHGHSVQDSSLHPGLHFQRVFRFFCIECRVIAQYPIIYSTKLPHYDCLMNGNACGCWQSPASNISLQGKLRSTLTSCGMIQNPLYATIERSVYIKCISSCWHHQSVISGIHNVLPIPMQLEW